MAKGAAFFKGPTQLSYIAGFDFTDSVFAKNCFSIRELKVVLMYQMLLQKVSKKRNRLEASSQIIDFLYRLHIISSQSIITKESYLETVISIHY